MSGQLPLSADYGGDAHPAVPARDDLGEDMRQFGPTEYNLPQSQSYGNIRRAGDVDRAKENARLRRKPASGADHVKHRRTRSGCYTCRSRRVKCDEARPTCERCRKGARECVYPEPPAAKGAGSSGTSKAAQARRSIPEESSSGEISESEELEKLATIEDEESSMADSTRRSSVAAPPKLTSSERWRSKNQSPSGRRRDMRTTSDPPSLLNDKSPTPSTDGSVSLPGSYSTARTPSSNNSDPNAPSKWSHLPADLRFYLNFFHKSMSHHHYSFKHDSDQWMRTTFLDIAITHDPLLYAVVGFAAYQHTLRNPNGKIQDFLGYYNKSVSLLRQSLQRNQKHTVATLLTILQLASIEEFLGDWVNLLSHHKAAYEILTELYTPQTIVQSENHLRVIGWYARFDLFAGLMSGYETVLGREWFAAVHGHYSQQSRRYPENINLKIEERIANSRLMAVDMAHLFARKARGVISDDDFLRENEIWTQRFHHWYETLDPALIDPAYAVTDFSGARELDPDDIVNPYVPGILFRGHLWTMNLVLLDYYAVDVMHKYQTALVLKRPPPPELEPLSFKVCQLFEAIEFWPEAPPGVLLATQASLGIATLFLPKDQRHTLWCRRKLATIELMGYIYPPTFREKMAQLWAEPEVNHWWLPNDQDHSQIIRSIRSFVSDRAVIPKDQNSEDLRDMKALFGSMKINDNPPTPAESPVAIEEHKMDEMEAGHVAGFERFEFGGEGQGQGHAMGFDPPLDFDSWGFDDANANLWSQ
ncbi:MAG: hypothetical protein M1819_003302 [Sarea resinae]|nr:MAG: hypothetical protein M1819_003302 [Sarea resinae]